MTGVLGHSIFDNSAKKKGSRGALPTSLVKRVIRQTLLALEYLHDECGVVHTCESAKTLCDNQDSQNMLL